MFILLWAVIRKGAHRHREEKFRNYLTTEFSSLFFINTDPNMFRALKKRKLIQYLLLFKIKPENNLNLNKADWLDFETIKTAHPNKHAYRSNLMEGAQELGVWVVA